MRPASTLVSYRPCWAEWWEQFCFTRIMEQFYSNSPNLLSISQNESYSPYKFLQGSSRVGPLLSCWQYCLFLPLCSPCFSNLLLTYKAALDSEPLHWLLPLHRMLFHQIAAWLTLWLPSALSLYVSWGWPWPLLSQSSLPCTILSPSWNLSLSKVLCNSIIMLIFYILSLLTKSWFSAGLLLNEFP